MLRYVAVPLLPAHSDARMWKQIILQRSNRITIPGPGRIIGIEVAEEEQEGQEEEEDSK